MLYTPQRCLKPLFQSGIIFITLLCFSIITTAQTQPRLINFQGKLTDQQGQPLDGTYTAVFSLYATATGGTAIWTERHENLSISQGLVNALLGSIQSLDSPQKVEFDAPQYLGITIDVDNNANSADPEMLPRQRIIPAIYAYNADTLDGKDSGFFTNPNTDAGRPGVVNDLYEGNVKLVDKYMPKDATNVNADKLDGYHATTSAGATDAIPVINSGITYTNLRAGFASSAESASSANNCTSCSSATSCSSCTNASNCTNCNYASSVNGLRFSPWRICIAMNANNVLNRVFSVAWPSNWDTDSCKTWACTSCQAGSWWLNSINSNGGASSVGSGNCP